MQKSLRNNSYTLTNPPMANPPIRKKIIPAYGLDLFVRATFGDSLKWDHT